MKLLNPWGLLALLALGPILALYFLRLYRQEVRVPSLLLWEAVLADRHANRPWQKLRRNWMMILQLLAAAVLALSLTRPAVPATLALHGRVIVLVDVSASMAARQGTALRLARAQAAVRELAGTLESGDRVALIAVGPEPELVIRDGDSGALLQAVDRLAAEDGPADWRSAATLAAGLASDASVTTLLVTDAAVDEVIPALPGKVHLVTVGGELSNAGIVAFSLRRTAAGLEAFVRVRNVGPAVRRTLALRTEGGPVASQVVDLPADGEQSVAFPNLSSLSWLEADLEGEDALALDDRAWVALPASAGGRVLVATSGNRFLTQALRGLADVAVEESTSLAPVQAGSEAYGLVVVDGSILTGTLPESNLWLIAPMSGTLCGQAGAVFSDTAPVRGLWDDPLLTYVDWSGVSVAQARHYTPPPDATVLLQAPGGPLLWTVERPGQRVACLAFALQDSDLPLRLTFPILTANLVGWLMPAVSAEPISPLPAGESWEPALPAATVKATWRGPDGTQGNLFPAPAAAVPTRAGLYRLEITTDAGTATRYVALSLISDSESDLRPRTLLVNGNPLPTVQEETPGWQEEGRWLLLAALVLILIEAVAWWGPLWLRWLKRKERPSFSGAAALRLLLLASLFPAFAGVRWSRQTRDLAVVFLMDRSASTQAAWQEELDYVSAALQKKGGDDRAGVVVFGQEAWVDRGLSVADQIDAVATFPGANATNVEEAVRLGLALIPDGAPGRLVVLTDGLETAGRAERALREARARGVDLVIQKVGTGAAGPEAWIMDLRLPTHAYPGDRIPLAVTVDTNQAQAVQLLWNVWNGGSQSGQQALRVQPGGTAAALSFAAVEPGLLAVRVCLQAEADTFPQNNCADGWVLVEGAPRVMVVGPASDRGALATALRKAGLTVEERDPEGLPLNLEGWAGYASLVLVNTPGRLIDPQAMTAIRDFVRDLGGGLVTVGGPNSYGVGGWLETPLEEALPVEMLVRDPRRFPPLAMAVIIDKSGSMSMVEGGVEKIRLAAEAAMRTAESLNDVDTLAVVAFDDRPADVIGPWSGAEREAIIARLQRLQAGGGGIYVFESLSYAARLLDQVSLQPNQQRHILLLADGSDAERQEGAKALVASLHEKNVTVSVVAIGSGQDVPFLRDLADTGGGRFYLTEAAADLPSIFAEETARVKRSYVVEKSFYPAPVSQWEAVAGIAQTPQLRGYVATTPKSTAQVVWEATDHDPLLAAWQYGLGRSVAWTSDATGRWSAGWVVWDDFARFWGGVVRWTLPDPSDPGLSLRVRSEEGLAHAVVDVVNADGSYADGLGLNLHVAGVQSGVAAESVTMRQTAPGRYEGSWPLRDAEMFFVQLGGDRSMKVGWAPPISPETIPGDAEAAVARLQALSEGRTVAQPGDIFAHDLVGRETGQPLAPLLTWLAVLLWPLDIAWRRLAMRVVDVQRWGVRRWEWVRSKWQAWQRNRKPSGPAAPPATLGGALRDRTRTPSTPATAQPPVQLPVPPVEPKPTPPVEPKKPEEGGDDSMAARLKRRVRQ